jgi:predicted DsbA family dithiol-disulfide isomerase
VRLRRLARELDGALVIEWRAFPLRTAPAADIRFKGTYREAGWRRAALMSRDDGIVYTPWPHARLPGSSLPALETGKCAARQGPDVFARVHHRLYQAFFTESRDIGDPAELERIAGEAGADLGRFRADYASGTAREEVAADYRAAVEEHGVRSIPTVIVRETGRALVGLVDLARYRAAVVDATG